MHPRPTRRAAAATAFRTAVAALVAAATVTGALAAPAQARPVVAAAAPAAPAADSSSTSKLQVGIRQTTEPTLLSGNAHKYGVKWACVTVSSDTCASDATLTLPFDVPRARVTVADGPRSHVAAWKHDDGLITIELGRLAAGESGEVPVTVTAANHDTPNGTTWTLKPTLTTPDAGTVTTEAGATSTVSASTRLVAFGYTTYTYYGPGAVVDLDGAADTYCPVDTGRGTMNVLRTRVVRTLPSTVKFISADDDGVWDPSTRTVTWDRTHEPGSRTGCQVRAKVRVEMGTAADGLTEGKAVTFPISASAWPIDGSDPLTSSDSHSVKYTTGTSTPGTVKSYVDSPFLHTAGESRAEGNVGYRSGIPARPLQQLSTSWVAAQPGVASIMSHPGGTSYAGVEFQPACRTTTGTVHASLARGQVCEDPAFNAYELAWSDVRTYPDFSKDASPDGPPVPEGWFTLVLTDGRTVDLTPEKDSVNVKASIPAQYLGHVAAVRVKAFPEAAGGDASLVVRGTADADLAAGTELRSTTFATWHARSGGAVVGTTSDVAIGYVTRGVQRNLRVTSGGEVVAPGLFLDGNLTDDITFTTLLPAGEEAATQPVVADAAMLMPWRPGFSWFQPARKPLTWSATPNWNGTGRTLLRATLTADVVNSVMDGWPGEIMLGAMVPNPQDLTPATYAYTLHYGGETTSVCGNGDSAPTTNHASDPDDVDGNPSTSTYCRAEATGQGVSWYNPPSAMKVTTAVSTPTDTAFATAPRTAHTAGGDTARYRATWTNNGQQSLQAVGLYTLLPRPGDTGTLPGSSTHPRGSTFAPTLSSIGDLPVGATVRYSRSTNPCRPELLPDNPGCDDDWSTTAPADLSDVTALHFTVPGSHDYGTRLEFNWEASAPSSLDGVAYATTAAYASNDTGPVLPVESSRAATATPSYRNLTVDTRWVNAPGGEVRRDETADLRVEAANDGFAPVTIDMLTDELPAAFTPTHISGDGTYDATTHTITWPGTTLAPGQTFTAAIMGTLDTDGGAARITNRFRASSDTDPHPLAGCTTGASTDACADLNLTGIPDVVVSGTFDTDTAEVGEEVEFTLRAVNTGAGPGEVNYPEVPYALDELELVSTTPEADGVYDLFSDGTAESAYYSSIPLEAGESVELTLRFKVLPGALGKTITTGGVTWNDETHLNACAVAGRYEYPAACDTLEVVPAVAEAKVTTQVCTVLDPADCDADPTLWGSSSEAPAGAEAYWRVVAANTGTTAISGTVIDHPLPDDLELVPGSAHASLGDLSSWPDQWDIGTLSRGQTAELAYRTRTPATATETTSRAALLADNPDDPAFPLVDYSAATLQISETDVDVTTQVCVDTPDDECAATDGPQWTDRVNVPGGTRATLRTAVTNTGTTQLRNVRVHAPLPAADLAPLAASTSHGTVTRDAQTWTLTDLAPGTTAWLTRTVTAPRERGKLRFPADVTALAGPRPGKPVSDQDVATIGTTQTKAAANVTVRVEGCRLTKSNCLRHGRKNWSPQPGLTARNGILWRVVIANTGGLTARNLTLRGTRTVTTPAGTTRAPLAKQRTIRALQPGQHRVLMLRTSAPRSAAVVAFKAAVRTTAGSQAKVVAHARAAVRMPARTVGHPHQAR